MTTPINRDQRRLFTAGQKIATAIVTGAEGEADHVTPHSAGGQTLVENCQLLLPEINRAKAAFNFVPRDWQATFLDAWDRRIEGNPFMLIAIPGSGKTMASLEAARRWMMAGPDRRLIVVVPTDNLREQWKSESVNFGIEMQTKEFGTDFKRGFKGGVVTYHLVANQPLVFRKLCSVAPTMVIFDEIHHCADEAHFGNGVRGAFELAAEKLNMSGTPWKTDGRPIPFVRYDASGFAIADYRYDYPDALNDDVVRFLVFKHSRGSITDDQTGESEVVDHSISDEEAANRLRKLLDADGEYVRMQVAESHKKLEECRRQIPDAAGLVVCIDQAHAVRIAKVIKEVTGCEPSVIVSDSATENDTVEKFRESSKEWLVSVRKVSEGTDIKRLQVLCYLTNTTSELFFRQVIGRVSRVRDMGDYDGHVFLPSDPRLVRCAQNIANAQVQAIKEQAESELREMERTESEPDFTTYSTAHDGTELVFLTGESIALQEARDLERIAQATGVSMQKIREIKSMLGVSSPDTSPQPTTRMEDRMDVLRKRCNKLAFRLSKVIGIEVQDIHRKFKKQSDMSEEELEAKQRAILKEINAR